MFRVENQVAVITGGAKGIGKATAEVFAAAGAKVALWDLDPKVEEIAAQIGGKAYLVDTSNWESVQNATAQTLADWGTIHILINNAGILRDASLLKMDVAQWEQVININLTGVFHCVKAILPTLKAQKYGRIINASSIAGVYGNFGQTNYSAAKAGVIGFTKSLAREVGRMGVTANAIAPGVIATEMTATIPQEYMEKMQAGIPVGRIGQVQDIAYAYLYLASPQAGFVNGAVLHVDGGMVL
ncbi:3-oxoacyl-ACP reductase FabG [Hugenholtzia roseola]|uniref:3-oxoacyl-ACP reductase FabG n=1 Tax=Hugenholtzia roseola TaxID=1002 RepID=UPI00040F2CE7|nr:3-oxoacyl-ACP reductase FabG [Hugenholtzia roseola]